MCLLYRECQCCTHTLISQKTFLINYFPFIIGQESNSQTRDLGRQEELGHEVQAGGHDHGPGHSPPGAPGAQQQKRCIYLIIIFKFQVHAESKHSFKYIFGFAHVKFQIFEKS